GFKTPVFTNEKSCSIICLGQLLLFQGKEFETILAYIYLFVNDNEFIDRSAVFSRFFTGEMAPKSVDAPSLPLLEFNILDVSIVSFWK
ncbi:MAG: hypothetical protein WBZ33_05180, partial [Thermoactinomyces sp.]